MPSLVSKDSAVQKISSGQNRTRRQTDAGILDSNTPPPPHPNIVTVHIIRHTDRRQRAVHTHVLQSLQDDHTAALAPSVAVGLVGERVALTSRGDQSGLAEQNEHVGG